MSIFGNLTNTGLEQAKDVIGGGYQPLESDIYIATVKAAYVSTSAGGAMAINFIFDIDGREYSESLWITSKTGQQFYEKNGKKYPLPGFTLVDDICTIATDKPLCQQDTEEKVVKVYDRSLQKEAPKSVPMLTDLLGCPVALAIQKVIEDKTAKDNAGNYVPTGETRTKNEIVKALHPEYKVTVNEANEGKDATYWDKWLEANKGKVRDKTKGAKKADDKKSGTSASATGTPSLFG